MTQLEQETDASHRVAWVLGKHKKTVSDAEKNGHEFSQICTSAVSYAYLSHVDLQARGNWVSGPP